MESRQCQSCGVQQQVSEHSVCRHVMCVACEGLADCPLCGAKTHVTNQQPTIKFCILEPHGRMITLSKAKTTTLGQLANELSQQGLSIVQIAVVGRKYAIGTHTNLTLSDMGIANGQRVRVSRRILD